MGVNKGPDSLVKASADSQTGANNHSQTLLPAADDEIPLDSSSEESQSSDVSMSDSEDEDQRSSLISTGNEYIPTQPLLSVHPTAAAVSGYQQSQSISKKRKSLERADPLSYTAVSTKKVKLDEDCNQPTPAATYPSDKSLLPPEIWHRIFSFVQPRALGNLLRVNKLFNVYLDPSSRYQRKFPPSPSRTSVPRMKSDAIWQLSRRRFWPRMPAPLQQKTELDMWRLACGKRCQICSKPGLASLTPSDDERHRKSQPIWAFATRSCGPCLMEKTISEVSLLLSSSVPSLLRSALPFVLITSEMETISPDALQKGLVQPDLQVTKIYLSQHVEELKQEFISVESMGRATAEEWLKGLEARGRESITDSMRWEKWASTGGVAQMQTQLSPDNVPSVGVASGKGLVSTDISSLASRPHPTSSATFGQHTPNPHPIIPIARTSQSTHSSPAASIQNDHAGKMPSTFQHGVQSSVSRVRTREEALELKAARRAEIERRAMELDPPLPANTLALIPSFQAAIQISSPLDDNAWDLLKPRLLAQRADAEQLEKREQGNSPRSPVTQEQSEERQHNEENSVSTKQLIDKAWDDVQTPLRARISAYADEIIRDSWSDGHNVDMENSPQFAAEVLLHVRKRFYTEISKEATEARATGQVPVEDPPEGPFTQKLTLENMKWLFDVKIKPLTESYRKDLFFCNGCEFNYKAFGFEGVIQHYAAKHTNVLSLGSIVVHWRAEWPETPPFKPDPRVVKAVQPPAVSYGTLQSQNYASVYSSASTPAPFQPTPYLAAPSSSYGHSVYGQTVQHPAPYSQGGLFTSGQHEYGSLYPHPSSYTYPNSHPSFPPGMHTGPPCHSSTTAPHYGHNYNASRSNSQMHFQLHPYGSPADIYHAQLQYLARSSRDLWSATAGLKELPGDIRVCVVIHHIVQRFRSKFTESPTLDLFIDGLSNNKEMRPVRNVNGLMCKACHLGFGPFHRTYSFPQLVNHFRQSHFNQPRAPNLPSLDWTVDMVHTPDLSVLTKLYDLANMDGQKYSLISDAFPQARHTTGFPQGVSPINLPNAQALNQSTASSTPTPIAYPMSQRGDPGQESSELRQGSNEIKPKRLKGNSTKDQNTSGQGFRNRTASVAATLARIKSQEPSDEDLVAEEDRRQEEEIRAMWAADRREAARLASTNQRPLPTEEPDVSAATREVECPRSYHTQATQIAGPPSHSTRFQGHQQPANVWEQEDDDLMAGLESQLDRQQVPPGNLEYQLRPTGDIQHARQPFPEKRVGSGHYIDSNRGHIYDQFRSGHAVYTQYEPRPHFDRYREGSPSSRSVDLVHESTRTQARLNDELYSQPPHQGYHQEYGVDPRARRPASQFAEAYELVRVRDSTGEYLVRQPVRLERERLYVPFQHSHTVYGDPALQLRAYENESYSGSQLRYDSASRTETPARQSTYEASIRPRGVAKTSFEPLDHDPAGSEDYDPRFPAAPPSSSTTRHVWYQ
ncbi:hypothetical protein F5Y06DRAFT_267156 [Hypoxylon sp. FL0890]|nr:hypothetical protein F5Y06DRAFT_267156 [Hypoxylon sp. FL0890]